MPKLAFSADCKEDILSITQKCDTALKEKNNQITGLEDALKQSRKQTDDALELKSRSPSLFDGLAPWAIGLAAGLALGAVISR